jgi:phenylalanyl-tRNA synthetase alpha chain
MFNMKLKFLGTKSFTFISLTKYRFCSCSNSIRNIPPRIEEKIGDNIYKIPNHPLNIIRNKIFDFFENDKYSTLRSKIPQETKFTIKDDFHPIVSKKENFYDLLVTDDNDTISPKNTYYQDEHNVLRTHMTAHDVQMIRSGLKSFITLGDVYRRDSIDATHYPIFHQIDGVRVFEYENLKQHARNIYNTNDITEQMLNDLVRDDLKHILENLNNHIFGEVKFRWVDAYFPFTEPSYELEIFFNGDWLEVLGCGLLRTKIIDNSGLVSKKQVAWAFGIGLERLAMKLFDIKDIRLFWTKDNRFLSQFSDGKIRKFKPYSKYPPCYKDITFYIPDTFCENDFLEIIRNVTGDLVEDVKCIDTFTNTKTNKTSKCFRILYRHMDKTLTNEEINVFQVKIRQLAQENLNLELR